MRLDGKVIVVVGGTSGLGLSAARACRDAGGRLVIVGPEVEQTELAAKQLGSNVYVITGDATSPETAEHAVRLAVEKFGRLDALYHVAGGSGRSQGDGPLHEISDTGWQYTVNLNLTSVLFSNRAGVRQFLQQKTGGVILNMGSVLAISPSPQFFATHAYATAKAGLIGLTRACAAYYAPNDIRCNMIAPGLVQTPMSRRAVEDDRIHGFVESKQPLAGGKVLQPEDLDATVVYLLSDASRFVTGQVLTVDGGWSVTEGRVPLP